MAVTSGYKTFVIEQLERIVPINARSMFGGVGLYAEDLFFALIADDRLYFKVDDTNRPDYEQAGMDAFRPYDDDRAMQYYEVPIDVLEDTDQLQVWVTKAVAVARDARRKKNKKKHS